MLLPAKKNVTKQLLALAVQPPFKYEVDGPPDGVVEPPRSSKEASARAHVGWKMLTVTGGMTPFPLPREVREYGELH